VVGQVLLSQGELLDGAQALPRRDGDDPVHKIEAHVRRLEA
jgi:hypothetical protein